MKNNNFCIKNGIRPRQAGYTLVELSITVSIIAVLIVGTLTGVQRLLRANNANNTLTQTQVATSNISRLFASSGASVYGTAAIAGTSDLAKLGVWDPLVVATVGTGATSTRTVTHPFSGRVQVGPNIAAVGAALVNTGYWYRISNIPEDVCPSLASSFVNSATGIYINAAASTTAAAISGSPASTLGYKIPGTALLNTANLATACDASPSGTVEIALFIAS
jgi:prepilin-type N-terminal cleavage/methylation domain-containing protein